jgi:hypothetical protein
VVDVRVCTKSSVADQVEEYMKYRIIHVTQYGREWWEVQKLAPVYNYGDTFGEKWVSVERMFFSFEGA